MTPVERGDLSVEVGHIYVRDMLGRDLAEVADTFKRRAQSVASWVSPILQAERSRGRIVSTCVLVDDYFWNPDLQISPQEIADGLVHAFAEADIAIDFVVFESALVDSVDLMLRRLVPKPLPGAGTRLDPHLVDAGRPRFLSNGVPAFSGNGDRRSLATWDSAPPDEVSAPDVFGVSGHHRIALEVELFDESSRPWACPTLAAWWQLVRLGMLAFEGGSALPPSTLQLNPQAPLIAKKCLTVLAPEFIEVEHAVRTILSQVHLDPEFLGLLVDGDGGDVAISSALGTVVIGSLVDVSYLFVEDDAQLD